jgi:hypothetical protein
MVAVRGFLLTILFICLAGVVSAFGSATNIYITQSGSPSGNCTSNVQTPAFFNKASNWGSSATQIGPGTTVLLCGTFTSSAQGGNILTTQGSGTSANPITINCDTTCTFQATSGWFGKTQEWGCSSGCSGAISVVNSYIILDGQGTGIIENMLAGNPGPASPGAATCLSGKCTQVPSNDGSAGIFVGADHVIVRNWTIQDIYNNFGSNNGNTDGGVGGQYTADIEICCAGNIHNAEIYNNTLANARAGITGDVGGTTGPNNCPSASSDFSGFSGICYHQNTFTDHGWQMDQTGTGSYNFYNNDVSDYANWFWPNNGTYHLDGIIAWGNNTVVTLYIYNNYFHGDQVGPVGGATGNATGFVYCSNTETGDPGDGSASSCWLFNNLFVGTGGSVSSGNAIWLSTGSSASPGNPNGPYYLYNNTVYGFAHHMYVATTNGSAHPYDAKFYGQNNLWQLNTNSDTGPYGGGVWHLQQNNNEPLSDIVQWDYNTYFNSQGSEQWNWGTGSNNNYSKLPSWSPACNCDSQSQSGSDPKLSSSYTPQTGSAAIGAGTNLSSLGITALNYDKPLNVGVGYGGLSGNQRGTQGACTIGTAGCWDAGAYQYTSGGSAPAPPTALTAVVN